MTVSEMTRRASPTSGGALPEDPEALMDEVWRLVERIGALATDPGRYHVDLIREGLLRGDLNLIEIGLHRFRDVEPLEDDED